MLPVPPGTGQLCKLGHCWVQGQRVRDGDGGSAEQPQDAPSRAAAGGAAWAAWCGELCLPPEAPRLCCQAAPNPFVPAVMSQGIAGAARCAWWLSRASSRAGAGDCSGSTRNMPGRLRLPGPSRLFPLQAPAAPSVQASLHWFGVFSLSCVSWRVPRTRAASTACAGMPPHCVRDRLAAIARAPSLPAWTGFWALLLEEHFPPQTLWSGHPMPSSAARLWRHPPAPQWHSFTMLRLWQQGCHHAP